MLATAGIFNIDARTAKVAAQHVVTDPPYGIGYKVNRRPVASAEGLKGTAQTSTEARDMITGDGGPFDPAPWLLYGSVAFFGAQHFHTRLPQGRWLVWDKRRETKPDDHSDGELVWMAGDSKRALRIHRQVWRGVVREGEENCSRSKKLHPNQKPVALIDRILSEMGVRPGETVFDPYMGSGSTGVVCLRRGINFIGCEIDAGHFETARQRLTAEFGAQRVFAPLDITRQSP